MLQTFFDRLKVSTGVTLRMMSLVIIAAVSFFVTICFLCAALFVAILQQDGLIAACLAEAVVFCAATIVLAASYYYRKRDLARRPAVAERSSFAAALNDPMVIAAGLQMVRSIGIKRLLPLLLIGGIGIALMARPSPPDQRAPE